MLVFVLGIVIFEDGIVNTLVSTDLKEDVDCVGDNEENRCDSRDLKNFAVNLFGSCIVGLGNSEMKGSWNDQAEATESKLAEFGEDGA